MKLALCLYGPVRHWNVVGPSLELHLLRHHEVDVFSNVYVHSGPGLYANERTHPRWQHRLKSNQNSRGHVVELAKLNARSQTLFDPSDPNSNFSNHMRQLMSTKPQALAQLPQAFWSNFWSQCQLVNEVATRASEYDWIIVSRADIIYLNNLAPRVFDSKTITFPKQFGSGWLSDKWFCSPPDLLPRMLNRWDAFPEVVPGTQCHPSEQFSHYINAHKIPWSFADVDVDIVQHRYTGWWWTPYTRDPDQILKVT
jgi:hypothetical protein